MKWEMPHPCGKGYGIKKNIKLCEFYHKSKNLSRERIFEMKKSEIYELALHAVLRDVSIVNSKKLEIIRELQDKESTALFMEKKEEENE